VKNLATVPPFALGFFLLIASACAKAPLSDAAMKSAAQQQANQCAQAMLSGDYELFVTFLHPKVIDLMGGKDALIQNLRDGASQMQAQGFGIKSVQIGDPEQIESSNSEVFAIMPETLHMTAPGGTLLAHSYMLGISDDGGQSWKFVDGAGIAKLGPRLTSFLPNLPADLKLPKPTQATFSPDPGAPPAVARPSMWATPVTVNRTGYQMTLPSGSTVDPPDPKHDADHYTVVNLPNQSSPTPATLTVIVSDNDDTRLQDELYTYAQQSCKSGTVNPTQSMSTLFDNRDNGKGTVISGQINGVECCCELGTFTGAGKGYLFICTYTPDDRDQIRGILRHVVESFLTKP